MYLGYKFKTASAVNLVYHNSSVQLGGYDTWRKMR